MKHALLTLLLAPIVFPQGLWVKRTAQRLPEAQGYRKGRVGKGKPLRLLLVGDSSAAGVGVEQQEHALLGQLICALQKINDIDFDIEWEWCLVAKSGATTLATVTMLSNKPAQEFDIAISCLGVNDVTSNISTHAWLQNQDSLREILQNKFGCQHVIVNGLPAVKDFPALPQPLRWFLGQRAMSFDESLRRHVQSSHNVNYHYLPLDFSAPTGALYAADGFHPSAGIYASWAQALANKIAKIAAVKLS